MSEQAIAEAAKVPVTIDGAAAGVLSLSGSTRALKGALGPCHGL